MNRQIQEIHDKLMSNPGVHVLIVVGVNGLRIIPNEVQGVIQGIHGIRVQSHGRRFVYPNGSQLVIETGLDPHRIMSSEYDIAVVDSSASHSRGGDFYDMLDGLRTRLRGRSAVAENYIRFQNLQDG